MMFCLYAWAATHDPHPSSACHIFMCCLCSSPQPRASALRGPCLSYWPAVRSVPSWRGHSIFFSLSISKWHAGCAKGKINPQSWGVSTFPACRGMLQDNCMEVWNHSIYMIHTCIEQVDTKKTNIQTYNLRFMRRSCESQWLFYKLYWNLNVLPVTEMVGKHLLFNSIAATFEQNFLRYVWVCVLQSKT